MQALSIVDQVDLEYATRELIRTMAKTGLSITLEHHSGPTWCISVFDPTDPTGVHFPYMAIGRLNTIRQAIGTLQIGFVLCKNREIRNQTEKALGLSERG